jgi:hypothetical protein
MPEIKPKMTFDVRAHRLDLHGYTVVKLLANRLLSF